MHSIVILEVPYENNFRWTVFNYLIVQLYVLIHNQTTCPKKSSCTVGISNKNCALIYVFLAILLSQMSARKLHGLPIA
jgi:hypothetical protein